MSIVKTIGLLSLVSVASVDPGCAQSADKGLQPKISSINVRLFYETSGTLSPDLPATFAAHNTIIGEGDAKEPANDFIVIVAMSIPGKDANVDLPLSVKVSNGKGKVLTQRLVKSHLFKEGKLVKAMLVSDATCGGSLRIEASIGKERRAKTMMFNCGE